MKSPDHSQAQPQSQSQSDALETLNKIERQIAKNNVILYMKGSPDFPMCGFSARVVHILKSVAANYAYINILENPDIRATLPKYANWPTFPQLYIQGTLIGGCDIVTELHAQGELKPKLQHANALSLEGKGHIDLAIE